MQRTLAEQLNSLYRNGMANHPDPNLAAIQKKTATQPTVPLHPADTKALLTQITTFKDQALMRKLAYASQHSITVALTDVEMASLLNEINLNGKT